MRTTSDAVSSVASGKDGQPIYWDHKFRDSKARIVEEPKLNSPVADTHAHLDMLRQPALALAQAAAHGVDFILTVVDPTEDPAYTYNNLGKWEKRARILLDEWKMHVPTPKVRVGIGCHPHNVSKYNREVEQRLIMFASKSTTSTIGEIGLDYHYDKSPRQVQREVFKRQIFLANQMMLPVALHLREAHADALEILCKEGMPSAGTLLHCFNLDEQVLQPFLDLGCHVAFGGPLTFKKSQELRIAAAKVPKNRIHTETDAPFMAPEPTRGTVCRPAHSIFTAAKLAEIFGVQGQDVAILLTQFYGNARRFFDRDTTYWQDNEKAIRVLLSKMIPGEDGPDEQ